VQKEVQISEWPLFAANLSVSIGALLIFWAAGISGDVAIGPINADISISGLIVGNTFDL
jgi:hypothetical protein